MACGGVVWCGVAWRVVWCGVACGVVWRVVVWRVVWRCAVWCVGVYLAPMLVMTSGFR